MYAAETSRSLPVVYDVDGIARPGLYHTGGRIRGQVRSQKVADLFYGISPAIPHATPIQKQALH